MFKRAEILPIGEQLCDYKTLGQCSSVSIITRLLQLVPWFLHVARRIFAFSPWLLLVFPCLLQVVPLLPCVPWMLPNVPIIFTVVVWFLMVARRLLLVYPWLLLGAAGGDAFSRKGFRHFSALAALQPTAKRINLSSERGLGVCCLAQRAYKPFEWYEQRIHASAPNA